LNVIKKTYKSSLPGSVIWTDKGNKGDVWNLAQVPLPINGTSSYLNFVLVMEAVSGSSTIDDIALDDLYILNGELCPSPNTTCSFKCQVNNQCVSEKQLCNFINDCPDGEDENQCGYRGITFENEVYGKWNFSLDTEYTWQLGNDGDSSFTGPAIGNNFNMLFILSF
jgi:hypothetical protein